MTKCHSSSDSTYRRIYKHFLERGTEVIKKISSRRLPPANPPHEEASPAQSCWEVDVWISGTEAYSLGVSPRQAISKRVLFQNHHAKRQHIPRASVFQVFRRFWTIVGFPSCRRIVGRLDTFPQRYSPGSKCRARMSRIYCRGVIRAVDTRVWRPRVCSND